MADLAACFSSDSGEWETPRDLFQQLNAFYGPFDLDAAASEYNHKCEAYYDKRHDALSVEEWNGTRIWLNPPYGRELRQWVGKAFGQAFLHGKLVCLLLPARTDTRWWHDFIQDAGPGVTVKFLKGRVRFVGAKAGAPFPSVVVVFDGRSSGGLDKLAAGATLDLAERAA